MQEQANNKANKLNKSHSSLYQSQLKLQQQQQYFHSKEFFSQYLLQYTQEKSQEVLKQFTIEMPDKERYQKLEDFVIETFNFCDKIIPKQLVKNKYIEIASILEQAYIIPVDTQRNKSLLSTQEANYEIKEAQLAQIQKLSMYRLQILVRILCIRLQYEQLTFQEKLPRNKNFKKKFEQELRNLIDLLRLKMKSQFQDDFYKVFRSIAFKALRNSFSLQVYTYFYDFFKELELDQEILLKVQQLQDYMKQSQYKQYQAEKNQEKVLQQQQNIVQSQPQQSSMNERKVVTNLKAKKPGLNQRDFQDLNQYNEDKRKMQQSILQSSQSNTNNQPSSNIILTNNISGNIQLSELDNNNHNNENSNNIYNFGGNRTGFSSNEVSQGLQNSRNFSSQNLSTNVLSQNNTNLQSQANGQQQQQKSKVFSINFKNYPKQLAGRHLTQSNLSIGLNQNSSRQQKPRSNTGMSSSSMMLQKNKSGSSINNLISDKISHNTFNSHIFQQELSQKLSQQARIGGDENNNNNQSKKNNNNIQQKEMKISQSLNQQQQQLQQQQNQKKKNSLSYGAKLARESPNFQPKKGQHEEWLDQFCIKGTPTRGFDSHDEDINSRGFDDKPLTTFFYQAQEASQ